MVGSGPMLKQPVQEPAPPLLGLVTVTVRAPCGAVESTVTLATTCCASVKSVDTTVTPLPEIVTFAPVTKPVPVTVSGVEALVPEAGGVSELGDTEVTCGPATTPKPLTNLPVPPSGLVTMTSRLPMGALEAMVI